MKNPPVNLVDKLTKHLLPAGRPPVCASLLALSLLCASAVANAASVPPLGTAADFGVLGASAVASTGATIVTGDLGVSPGTAVDGFPPGIVTGTTYVGAASIAGAAQDDAVTAYNDAAAQTCTTDMTGVDLGGKTLTPGVYCFDTSGQLTGTLTLDFQNDSDAVFIFQTGSTITTGSNGAVVAINGSPSCSNVTWQIGSSATLGAGTQFLGNILALASVTLATGASNSGGLYALTGAVTMDTSSVQACGAPLSQQCQTDDECNDDGNVCTDELCDPEAQNADAFGCIHPDNTRPCDDNLFCNGADTCSDGSCGHAGDPCVGGGACGNSCNETADNCFVVAGTQCRGAAGVCDIAENCTGASGNCPADVFLSTRCRASAGVCDVAEFCTGSSPACPADGFQTRGTACTGDGNVCTDDTCNGTGSCRHTNNTAPCNDGAFCTVGDTCSGGQCSGSTRDCGDDVSCTVDSCDENANTCGNSPSNQRCDDHDPCTIDTCDSQLGCDNEFSCRDICRSSEFYGKRAGDGEGDGNLTQSILDAVGGLEVCGRSITETSHDEEPYLEGLGLDSALEGLCVQTDGVAQRSLYRELVTAALNCAISGSASCDAVVSPFIGVSFSECDALCADNVANAAADDTSSSLERECIRQLDCYNSGGRMVHGKCALGNCSLTGKPCGARYGLCPSLSVKIFTYLQICERFSGNCHDGEFCQPAFDICPSRLPATSKPACREAKYNSCTIDSCE